MNQLNTAFQEPMGDDLIALGSDPIPAAPYYDERWFELERDAIFRRTWISIGHSSELPEPGSFIVRELEFARVSIIIARGKDDVIRAFHNVCTHRGTRLVNESEGRRSTFSCPYHRWTFGNDGRFLSGPDFARFHIEDSSICNLPPVALDTCAGLLFVNLEAQPRQTLHEFLGPMGDMISQLALARATTFDEYTYRIKANWKLVVDNFQENYHLRFVHRRTNGAPSLERSANPFNYPARFATFGPHRMNTSPGGTVPDEPPKPLLRFFLGRLQQQTIADGLAGGPHERDYFIFFPNLFVFGNPAMHFTHEVRPISAQESLGIFRFYWIGEDTSANERLARELALAFGREIHAEDSETIELGQLGLASGAIQHIHFQEQEIMCRHLYESVKREIDVWLAENQQEATS